MPRTKDPSLVVITIRLRKIDVQRARKRGRELGLPYQHVIRAWIAEADHETR
jgi:predicted DNA binding CopG/RHH family protein